MTRAEYQPTEPPTYSKVDTFILNNWKIVLATGAALIILPAVAAVGYVASDIHSAIERAN